MWFKCSSHGNILEVFLSCKWEALRRQAFTITNWLSQYNSNTFYSNNYHKLFEEIKQSTRSPYVILTPVQWYQVAKRAAEHGVTASIRYYSRKFPDLALKETIVRRLKILTKCLWAMEYTSTRWAKFFCSRIPGVLKLPCKKTGCPLLLDEEMDQH